ncbi:hypothetical protein [Brucella intermedia]|uniref:hypothetical protein n=1 Tax=Brucella intermedia TaxID=94625 RepID=UPI002362B093|nr:hypothetical protein [Brucella intermedia]
MTTLPEEAVKSADIIQVITDLRLAILQDDDEGLAEHAEPMVQAKELIAKLSASPFLSVQGAAADDCPCTKIQQDETCPVGYPSLLCEICDGKGVVQPSAARELALEEAAATEDTGNPVNYNHAEAMQVMAKCACKVCGGTGERNDADCGDIYFNTWVCDGCGGKGWDRQAYFEAFPSIRALSSPANADAGKVEGDGRADLERFWRPISEADKSITFEQTFDTGDGKSMTIRNSDHYWVRDADGRVYEATWSDHKGGYWWDLEGESPVDPVEYMPHPPSLRSAPASEKEKS